MRVTGRTLDETVALARSLIQLKSANPPGDEEEIARYVRDYLSANGIEAELIPLEPGRSSLVGQLPGRERGSIVLCGHLDTVAVEGNEPWTKPPFEGLIEDGRLYGRGAADMKGGVAVLLQAAKLVKSANRPRKTLLLALTADEEQGYRGAETLVKRGFFEEAEFMVVAEPSDGKVFIGEKGELWLQARFLGRAAHGSTPELGVSALLPAAAFCTRLNAEAAFLPGAEGQGKTTLNIGRFSGGWRVNIVPDRAEVELDFRVSSEETKGSAISLVKRLGEEEAVKAGARFEHALLSYHPPVFSDLDDRYVRAFLAAAGETAPGVAPYCTDVATIVPEVPIPFVIFGPGSIALAHWPDEYVELGSLERALKVLLAFLEGALL